MMDLIQKSISDSIAVKQAILADPQLLSQVERAAEVTLATLKAGGKVLICGNGGSAADTQHLAGEFVSRFRFDRPPLPAIAFNTNTSTLTSIGNDYEYAMIFSRQVEAFGKPGDILWGITTTGGSENIRRAFEAARSRGITTVGFLGGSGGACLSWTDIPLLVPSFDTPRVQESHILLGHILCDCVEQAMFGTP